MIAALLAASVLAAGPCDDPALAAAQLASAQAEPDLARALSDSEASLGAPLLLLDELARPLPERAGLAAARLGTACAWLLREARQAGDRAPALRAVLDRPDFAGARDRAPRAVAQAWERMKAWLLSLLEDRTTRSFASGVRWLVLGLSATLAGTVLWRTWRRRQAGHGAPAGHVVAEISKREAPVDHLHAARAQIPAAPRAALREALLGLLAALGRAGWLPTGRALTNRELAEALRQRPGGDEACALLRGFDRRFYSLQAVTPEDAATFLQAVEATCGRLPREDRR